MREIPLFYLHGSACSGPTENVHLALSILKRRQSGAGLLPNLNKLRPRSVIYFGRKGRPPATPEMWATASLATKAAACGIKRGSPAQACKRLYAIRKPREGQIFSFSYFSDLLISDHANSCTPRHRCLRQPR